MCSAMVCHCQQKQWENTLNTKITIVGFPSFLGNTDISNIVVKTMK